MVSIPDWLRPVRRLGNAGALDDADRACRQRREAEAQADVGIRRVVASVDARPGLARQSA